MLRVRLAETEQFFEIVNRRKGAHLERIRRGCRDHWSFSPRPMKRWRSLRHYGRNDKVFGAVIEA